VTDTLRGIIEERIAMLDAEAAIYDESEPGMELATGWRGAAADLRAILAKAQRVTERLDGPDPADHLAVLIRASAAVGAATDWEADAYDAQTTVEHWALDALDFARLGNLDRARALLDRYEDAAWEVRREYEPANFCECGEPNTDGEGYDGKCGNCADRAENEENPE
jgi:hypothetical protein